MKKAKDVRDLFISYNKNDRGWAEWIGWTLEENGYSIFMQDWDFRGNFVDEMNESHLKSLRTLLVLSINYFSSDFTQAEWMTRFREDPSARNDRIIPVKVGEVVIEGLLASLIYIDLTECDEAEAKNKLLSRVKSASDLKFRSKPEAKPKFPGSAASEILSPVFPKSISSQVITLKLDTDSDVDEMKIKLHALLEILAKFDAKAIIIDTRKGSIVFDLWVDDSAFLFLSILNRFRVLDLLFECESNLQAGGEFPDITSEDIIIASKLLTVAMRLAMDSDLEEKHSASIFSILQKYIIWVKTFGITEKYIIETMILFQEILVRHGAYQDALETADRLHDATLSDDIINYKHKIRIEYWKARSLYEIYDEITSLKFAENALNEITKINKFSIFSNEIVSMVCFISGLLYKLGENERAIDFINIILQKNKYLYSKNTNYRNKLNIYYIYSRILFALENYSSALTYAKLAVRMLERNGDGHSCRSYAIQARFLLAWQYNSAGNKKSALNQVYKILENFKKTKSNDNRILELKSNILLAHIFYDKNEYLSKRIVSQNIKNIKYFKKQKNLSKDDLADLTYILQISKTILEYNIDHSDGLGARTEGY